jgi:hypothetical protein
LIAILFFFFVAIAMTFNVMPAEAGIHASRG